MRLKVLFLALALALVPTLAPAATIPFSAPKVLDNLGNALTSGKITVQPLDGSGNPTGSLLVGTVVNGVMATALQLPTTSTQFHVSVTNTAGSVTYLDLPKMTVQNVTAYSLGSYSAPATAILSGLGTPRVTCQPGAQFTQTDTQPGGPNWVCSKFATTGEVVWTQSPAATASCPLGQAWASPQIGAPYCVPQTLAWVLPGQGLVNGSSTQPGPLQAGTVSSSGGSSLPHTTSVLKGDGIGGAAAVTPSDIIAGLNAAGQILANSGSGVAYNYLAIQSRKQYDCADPQFAGGMLGATPDAAFHACVLQAACDHALLVSGSQEIILPTGTIGLLTGIVAGAGSHVHSAATFQYGGATHLYDNSPGHTNITMLSALYGYAPVCNGVTAPSIGADDVTFEGITASGQPDGTDTEQGFLMQGTHDDARHLKCSDDGGGMGGSCLQMAGLASHAEAIMGNGLHAFTERGVTATTLRGVVEMTGVDSTIDGPGEVYTGEGQMHPNGALGVCGEKCAGYVLGANVRATGLFAERSNPGIATLYGASNIDVAGARCDLSSGPCIINYAGSTHIQARVLGACLDSTIANCSGVQSVDSTGGNKFEVEVGGNGNGGTSYYKFLGEDDTSSAGNRDTWDFQGTFTPDVNSGAGLRALYFQYQGGATIAIHDDSPWGLNAGNTTPNVELKRNITVNGNVTGIIGGFPGQEITLTSFGSGYSIQSGSNIYPCNGMSSQPIPTNGTVTLRSPGGDPYNGLKWFAQDCYAGIGAAEHLNSAATSDVFTMLGNMVVGQVPNPPAFTPIAASNSGGTPDPGSANYVLGYQIGSGWVFTPVATANVAPDANDYINIFPAAGYYGAQRYVLYRTANGNSLNNCAILQNTNANFFNDNGVNVCLTDGTIPALSVAVAQTNSTGLVNAFAFAPNGNWGIAGQCYQSQGVGVAGTWGACGSGGSVYTATSPVIVSGSVISIQNADAGHTGAVVNTDWSTWTGTTATVNSLAWNGRAGPTWSPLTGDYSFPMITGQVAYNQVSPDVYTIGTNTITTAVINTSGQPAFLVPAANGVTIDAVDGTITLNVNGTPYKVSANASATAAGTGLNFLYATVAVSGGVATLTPVVSLIPPIVTHEAAAPVCPSTASSSNVAYWHDLDISLWRTCSASSGSWSAGGSTTQVLYLGVFRSTGSAVDIAIPHPPGVQPAGVFSQFGDGSAGFLNVTSGTTTVVGCHNWTGVYVAEGATLTTLAPNGTTASLGICGNNQTEGLLQGTVTTKGLGWAGGTGTTTTGNAPSNGGFGGSGGYGGNGGGGNTGHSGGSRGVWGLWGQYTGSGTTYQSPSTPTTGWTGTFVPPMNGWACQNGTAAPGGAGAGDGTTVGPNGGAAGGPICLTAPAWYVGGTLDCSGNAGTNASAGVTGGGGGGGACYGELQAGYFYYSGSTTLANHWLVNGGAGGTHFGTGATDGGVGANGYAYQRQIF